MEEHLLKYDFLSIEVITKILSFCKLRTFKKKELLVRSGDVTRHVYFINKGCVRLFLIDYSGKEHSILFGTEGYWMGDLKAFQDKTFASYNYQAIEETEVLAINRSDWDRLLQEEPDFVQYVSVLFRNALIVQQDRIVEFFTLSAEDRYKNLMGRRKDLLNRVPQKYIASYIGITPEFLSYLRKKASED